MQELFIDIETIPTQRPGALEEIASTITAPGQYKKAESIEKWLADNAVKEAENLWRKTALNGANGEIICIGFALCDAEPVTFYRDLDESEGDVLQRFYDSIGFDDYLKIGHNLRQFDLRFLFQRSVICGVKPSIDLGVGNRYDKTVFDTMEEWAGFNNRISLVNLCAALGIDAKAGDITGANVWDNVKAGNVSGVADYCADDVSVTRQAYRRMTFQ